VIVAHGSLISITRGQSIGDQNATTAEYGVPIAKSNVIRINADVNAGSSRMFLNVAGRLRLTAIRLVTTGVRQLIRGSCDESSHGRLFYISELHHAPPTKHWTAFPIRSYSRLSKAMIPFNPFGLTIIYFREDQVFQ
jgi:hypothetical protein